MSYLSLESEKMLGLLLCDGLGAFLCGESFEEMRKRWKNTTQSEYFSFQNSKIFFMSLKCHLGSLLLALLHPSAHLFFSLFSRRLFMIHCRLRSSDLVTVTKGIELFSGFFENCISLLYSDVFFSAWTFFAFDDFTSLLIMISKIGSNTSWSVDVFVSQFSEELSFSVPRKLKQSFLMSAGWDWIWSFHDLWSSMKKGEIVAQYDREVASFSQPTAPSYNLIKGSMHPYRY